MTESDYSPEDAPAQVLLMASFGPVQPFIAQARRTQDLWVGSRILHLIGVDALRAAIRVTNNPTLNAERAIFPVLVGDQVQGAMPNRFIVRVPSDSCIGLAENAEQSARKRWQAICDQTQAEFAQFVPDSGSDSWRELWTAQCDSWLEFYWACVPLDVNQYTRSFRAVSQLLAARKQFRSFPSLTQPGEKCTLNGVLSALSSDPDAKRVPVREFWEKVLDKVNGQGQSEATLHVGERLCAVNTVKRFAQYVDALRSSDQLGDRRFPSTSTIAAAPYKYAVAQAWNATLENQFAKLRKHLAPCDIKPIYEIGYPALEAAAKGGRERGEFVYFDADFIRPEGYTVSAFADYVTRVRKDASEFNAWVEEAFKCYREFDKAVKNLKLSEPLSSYYAIIKLDGDRMGDLIGNLRSSEDHQSLSKALANYAKTVARELVETIGAAPAQLSQHWPEWFKPDTFIMPGRLIYSGGDDVLAMVPAVSALSIAEALRSAFAGQVNQFRYSDNELPAASVGIAFAHYTQPLETVLAAARHAEDTAKRTMGRNALTATLMRRSGETRSASCKWEYPDEQGHPVSSVQRIESARRAFAATDQLSSKLAYEAVDLAHILDEACSAIEDYRTKMQAARRSEFLRLIKRHSTPPTEATNATLGEQWAALAEAISAQPPTHTDIGGWHMLSDWLIIARFLAKGD